MYGFKPQHAQGKPVQNLADGGIVHSLTGMLGMRKRTPEELRAADAKSQARNQEAATAAAGRAQAAPAPATPAAPAKGISEYSGMSAMQRREKEQGLKDGGMVKARGFKAPWNIIKTVQAAVDLPFDEGMKRERELFTELLTSSESAAQRYYFFAEREAAKVLDVPADTPQREIKTGGIIGAWLFSRLQYNALLAPAILTGAIGIGYVLYRQWTGVRRDPST